MSSETDRPPPRSIETAVAEEENEVRVALARLNSHYELLAALRLEGRPPWRLLNECYRLLDAANALDRVRLELLMTPRPSQPMLSRRGLSVPELVAQYLMKRPMTTFTWSDLVEDMVADGWDVPGTVDQRSARIRTALNQLGHQPDSGVFRIDNDRYQYDPGQTPIGRTAEAIAAHLDSVQVREFTPVQLMRALNDSGWNPPGDPVALIAAALTRLASTSGSGVAEIDRERYRFDSFCATVHSGEPG